MSEKQVERFEHVDLTAEAAMKGSPVDVRIVVEHHECGTLRIASEGSGKGIIAAILGLLNEYINHEELGPILRFMLPLFMITKISGNKGHEQP